MNVATPGPSAREPSGEWTPEHVGRLLVKARRAFSGRVLYVVPGAKPGSAADVINYAEPVGGPAMPAGPFKVLHWMQRNVPNEWERQQLRVWIVNQAGVPGPTLREVVRAHPSWGDFSTYTKRRKRMLRRICRDLAKRGVPWFDLDEEGHVIEAPLCKAS